jgi:hypothetical protein
VTSPPHTTVSGLLVGGEWVESGDPLPVLDTDPRIVVLNLSAPAA